MQSTLDLSALKANQNIAARNYWKNRLSGLEYKTYFPAGGSTGDPSGARQYGECAAEASPEAGKSLNSIAKTDKAKNLVLLAAMGILARNYSLREDICILSAWPDRSILPVRMNEFSSKTFPEFLTVLKDMLMTDSRYGNYPLSRMLAVEATPRSPQSIPVTGMLIEDMQDRSAFGEFEPDLLFLFRMEGGLSLRIKYNTAVYDPRYMELIPEAYWSLLNKLIEQRDRKLEEIEWLPEQEKHKIVHLFNDTGRAYPADGSIAGLFEQQVSKMPDRTAVEYKGRAVTYSELSTEADRLAGLLLERGVKKGEPVALLLERSVDFITSVLAVLKVGCLYLPIDKSLPDERIHYFLEDSRARWLLTKEQDELVIKSLSTDDLPEASGEWIYLLYTSGSTGRPKGVIGTQKGLLNRLYWGWERYPFGSEEVCCQKTNIGFGDHVVEIFSPLLSGVPLVILSEEETSNVQQMAGLIRQRRISRITLVPSLLRELIRVIREKPTTMDTLRYVFTSGETLPYQLAKDFYALGGKAKLINVYGSTEVSADVTSYEVDRAVELIGGKVPIGKPLFNTQLLIVDKYQCLLPIGVPGEILISGDGVSPGYWHGGDANGEKFAGSRYYKGAAAFRSGDLGRWMPDGNIEYLGRLDHQVKVRGNRVRLDEIGEVMNRHEWVRAAVVIAKDAEDDSYLIGYYTGEEIKVADWKLYLGSRLPEYMIPTYFVRLDHLPLTPSGKLDRGALPEPAVRAGADYQAPSNEMEEKLVEIWARILKLDKKTIGVNTSFFELGGHSLRAMTLVNIIQGELGLEASIKDIFDHKEIASLAVFLRSSRISRYTQLKKAEPREYYPLSIAQQRLQYLYELDRSALTFNLPAVVRMEGTVNKEKVFEAFQQLIARQDILRTYFELVDDHPVQRIAGHCDFEMEYFEAAEEEVDMIVRSFIRPFDLREAPLLRAGLIEETPERYYMMVDMHHIISDGTSIGLLIKDFMALYNDIEMPPVELSYKDYAVWQQSPDYQQKIARQKEYWVREFSEPLTPLDVPVDFLQAATTEGDSVRFDLSPEETRQVRAIAEQEVATISMLILSVLTVVLSKIARQEDIVVGMVVAGREQVELENMIGMFPVVLPLRVYPRAELSFRELLANLKSTFLSTFDNQSYQYEELARELNLERSSTRNPWFDVMYLYQNFEVAELVLPGLKITSYKEQNLAAYERLNLTVSENDEQIFLKMVYARALFRVETIERWTGYFKRTLSAVLHNLDIRIADVMMITDQERSLLLHTGQTDTEMQRDVLYSELFAAQVEATPLAVAVEHRDSLLTYKELYDRSVEVASRLAAAGVGPGSNVAVILPRSIDLLTAFLGILHCGGTYVPLDVDYPALRIQEILMDSQSKAVVTSREWEGMMGTVERVIYVDEPVAYEPVQFDREGKGPDDLAYIIYTSGTTGKPKGVMIHQLGMINHLYALIEILNLDSSDVVAQTAAACFDISIWQFLAALITGGKVRIVDRETVQDPYPLLEELQEGGITIFQTVPSLMARFLDEVRPELGFTLPQLRWMIPTGESLPVALAVKWYAQYPDIPLLNAYGPAEASDDVTTCLVEPPQNEELVVPVGKPVRNMRVWILDEYLHLCAVGVKGEICVSGPGVGKGYWNDPERTKQVFVPNPFNEAGQDADHATLYRTGDLGYYLPDHNIVYAGRKDDQVKIRGFRVELGEIQHCLLQQGSIREAAVLVKEWTGEKYLVAYYAADNEIAAALLEDYLAEKLPAYMIPAHFVHVDRFPLTPNGKLDKRALPDPEIRVDAEYAGATTEMQHALVEMWAAVLKISIEEISIDASFFHLGGHSLSVIALINKMSKEFKIRMPLKDFFAKPTVRSTAEYLEVRLRMEGDAPKERENIDPGQPVYEVSHPDSVTLTDDYEEIKL